MSKGMGGLGDEGPWKDSIDQIVEVCNVPRDDALEMLERCEGDVQLAIDRFLSGFEEEWNEVGKKKKQPAERKQPAAEKKAAPRPRQSNRSGAPVGDSRGGAGNSSREPARTQPASGTSRGRSRRGKGGAPPGGRGDRRDAADRAERGPRNTTDSRKDKWSNEEQMPEWALPSNLPAADNNSGGFAGGAWVEKPGLESSWKLTDEGLPSNPLAAEKAGIAQVEEEVNLGGWQPADEEPNVSAWQPADEIKVSAWQPAEQEISVNAWQPTEAPSQFEAIVSSTADAAATSRDVVPEPAPNADLPKPRLNFAAIVAAGTVHDRGSGQQTRDAVKDGSVQTGSVQILRNTRQEPVRDMASGSAPAADPAEGVRADSAPAEIVDAARAQSVAPAGLGDVDSDLLASWNPIDPDAPPEPQAPKAEPAVESEEPATQAWGGRSAGADMAETKAREEVDASGRLGEDREEDKAAPGEEMTVDQLNLQFGSFAMRNRYGGAEGGAREAESGWKDNRGVDSAPDSRVPQEGEAMNSLNHLGLKQGARQETSKNPDVRPVRRTHEAQRQATMSGGFAETNSYPAHMPQPHQQYSMVPVPYAQYNAHGRAGMPSGTMHNYYNPPGMDMMPPGAYREAKDPGAPAASTGAGSGRERGGKQHQDGSGQSSGHGGVGGSSMEPMNPYMMTSGFPPYASMYTFPHNPYGGGPIPAPPPGYPQYAHAGAPPGARGSGRGEVGTYREGSFGPGGGDGPDSHLYGPIAYMGVPMMPDMQAQHQQHHQHQAQHHHAMAHGQGPQHGYQHPAQQHYHHGPPPALPQQQHPQHQPRTRSRQADAYKAQPGGMQQASPVEHGGQLYGEGYDAQAYHPSWRQPGVEGGLRAGGGDPQHYQQQNFDTAQLQDSTRETAPGEEPPVDGEVPYGPDSQRRMKGPPPQQQAPQQQQQRHGGQTGNQGALHNATSNGQPSFFPSYY